MKTLLTIISLTLGITPCMSQEIYLKEHPYKKQGTEIEQKKESKQLFTHKWINNEKPKNQKPKFIEFWATWCGPCIAFLPKYNKLQEEYGNQIDFITISNESLEKVSKFLDKREIKGFVALDDNNKTWEEFKITEIPKTFLIDKNGIVQWQGHPSGIDKDKLNKLSNGIEFPKQVIQAKAISLTEFIHNETKEMENKNEGLIINTKSDDINFSLSKSKVSNGRMLAQTDKNKVSPSLVIMGGTLKKIITFISSEPTNRVIAEQSLGKEIYDIKITSKTLGDYDKMIEKAIQEIEQHFNIKIKKTTDIRDVYFATITDHNKYKSQNLYSEDSKDLGGTNSSGGNSLKLTNKSLNVFVKTIEQNHNVFLDLEFNADKTRFNLDLLYDDVDEMFDQVEEQIGVRFVKGKRPTRVLEITKI